MSGTNQITVDWSTPATGTVTGYNVYTATASGGPYTLLTGSPVTGNNYVDTTATGSSPVYYEVTALNGADESGDSPYCVSTPNITRPPAPNQVKATVIGQGSTGIELAWKPAVGASSYNVFRGTNSMGALTLIMSGLPTSPTVLNDSGLSASTTYYYVVTATQGTEGQSASSPRISATTGSSPLSAPTGVTAVVGGSTVYLSWSSVGSATAYDIYYSTTSGGEGAVPEFSGITATNDTLMSLTNGSAYYFQVAAVDADGEGTYSTEVAATPNVHINCGGMSYLDGSNVYWAGDEDHSGGSDISTASTISGTSDQTLYQNQRNGSSFSYSIPVTNGDYALTLKFAEIQGYTTGQREFNVSINSLQVLSDFDIAATAGDNTAVDRMYNVNVTGGTLSLSFTGVVGDACIAGIELTPSQVGSVGIDVPEPSWATVSIPRDIGSDGEESGPGSSIIVNLPALVSENDPGPDIWAYNPLGPGVSYQRYYRSTLATSPTHTGSAILNSPGWTDNYDLAVTSASPTTWSNLTLTYPDSSTEVWSPTLSGGSPTGAFTTPTGSPYMVTGVASGTYTGQWTSISITFKDHSQMIFTPAAVGSSNAVYLYTGIENLVGHVDTINRDTSANGYRVTSITNDASTPATLLQFNYSGSTLTSIEDLESPTGSENRQVAYTISSGELTDVSQISATGAMGVADRWTYTYGDTYNGVDLLTCVAAPDPANVGSSIMASVSYANTGQVMSVKDAVGRKRTYQGVTTGSVAGIGISVYNADDSLAESWTQNYGTSLNTNTGFIDAKTNTETWAYTDSNNPYQPTSVTDRNSHVWTPTYTDDFGNVGTLTDPRGDEITNTFSYTNFALGQLTQTQEANSGDSLTKQATTFSYYGSGDGIENFLLHTVHTPAPDTVDSATYVTTTYTYTTTASSTAAGGQVYQVTVPGNNNGSLTTTFIYTSDSSYNATGGSGSYSQDEYVGEPLTVEDAAGDTTHYRYDGRGNVTYVIDANSPGNVTAYTYNLADQLVSVTAPVTTGSEGSETLYTYQYVGGPVENVKVYDESGTQVREVDYTYTHEGETASVTGSTQPATYTYDGRGRLLTLEDGNNNVTSYAYDDVGNLSTITYPNASGAFDVDQFTCYDKDQNLLKEINGNDITKTYTRDDPESLVTEIDYSNSYPSVDYNYDGFGRCTEMSDGTGSQTYTYDDLDELETMNRDFTSGPQNQELTYTHYNDGSLDTLTLPTNVSTALTDNSGNFGYQYDGAQRLTQVNVPFTDNSIGGTTGDYLTHTYYPNGWIKQTNGLLMHKSPSGSTASTISVYGYNARGFLTSLNNQEYDYYDAVTAYTSQFSSMSYDAMGNRNGFEATIYNPENSNSYPPNASKELTYTYDTTHTPTANRDVMVGEDSALYGSGSSDWNDVYNYTGAHGFSYDAAFNDTAFSWGGNYLSYGFNNDNQIDETDFSFDGEGNPTQYDSGSTNFTFDPENRLTGITSPSFSASYDGDGMRASDTLGGVTTYFIYSGDIPVVEETYSGSTATISTVNVWGADGWRARYYASIPDFYSFNFDPEGNVVDKTYGGNSYTAPYSVASYEAYGHRSNEIDDFDNSPATHEDPAQFGGEWGYYTDEIKVGATLHTTGLICMTHRYYDPGTGRFINRDPIGYDGGINLYELAGGNPVNERDPSGLDTLVFTGDKLKYFDDQHRMVFSIPAYSGMPGGGSDTQHTFEGGCIPAGTYYIDKNEIRYRFPYNLTRNPAPASAPIPSEAVEAWGEARTPIHPVDEKSFLTKFPERNPKNFFLHGGKYIGSAGCIDTGNNELFLFDYLNLTYSIDQRTKLIVDYSNWHGTVPMTKSGARVLWPDNTESQFLGSSGVPGTIQH